MLTSFIRKLEAFGPLPDRDKRALEQAMRRTRQVAAGRDLVRESDHPTQCRLILQGFSYRHRTVRAGRRQIMSFEIPGDLCGLHGVLLGQADHAVTTLTPCTVVTVPREVLTDWVENRPAVARALWCGAMVDAAVSRAWMLNIGGRTARGRIAHLLCEMLLRLQSVGLAEDGGCTLPIPPAEIADALGLSVVHVNRTLRGLHGEGLATPGDGQVTIDDLPGLQAVSGFDPAYLHLSGYTGGNAGGWIRSRRTGRAVVAAEPRATGLEPGDGDRLRSILQTAADHAIVATNLDGHITGWWGGAYRLLG